MCAPTTGSVAWMTGRDLSDSMAFLHLTRCKELEPAPATGRHSTSPNMPKIIDLRCCLLLGHLRHRPVRRLLYVQGRGDFGAKLNWQSIRFRQNMPSYSDYRRSVPDGDSPNKA